MIDIQHLSKQYGDTLAVDDVTVRVEQGELFALLGPNGAGKSSTVKVITGLSKPSTGIVRVAGYDVVEQSIDVRRVIGYVPENAMLYESLTADEYLRLAGELRHMDRRRIEAQRDELFDIFGLTDDDRKKLLSEFSKGMKQKVLLIAGMMHNPSVLILDEPLSGLDANAALIVKELLKRFAQAGKTIFLSSHVLDVVEKLCDRIGILNKGQLVAIGTPKDILEQTGQASLERAFNALTSRADIEQTTEEVVRSLTNQV